MTSVDELLRQALALHQAGRLAEANEIYRAILAHDQRCASAWYLSGVLATQAGQPDVGASKIENAIRLGLHAAEVFSNLGESFRRSHRIREAASAFNQALQIDPNHPDSIFGMAIIFNIEGHYGEARTLLQRLITLRPGVADVHHQLGVALAGMKLHEEAINQFQLTLRINPENVEAMISLSRAHQAMHDLGASINWLERAFAISPSVGLGKSIFKTCLQLGRMREALEVTERVLSRFPQDVETHCNRSMALLALGDYVEGFREYEWRARLETSIRTERKFNQPKLEFNDPAGRTILIHTEQGFGDVIHFIRYVPMLADRGATIMLDVPSELRSVLEGVRGVSRVLATGQRLPDFDFHAPLMSLARIFGTSAKTIPASIPYIVAPPARVERWKPRIGQQAAGLKVGLVWAGNVVPDPKRTVPIDKIAALADAESVNWYSLQVGERSDVGELPQRMRVADLASDIFDFADTSAILSQLDLLITIDTATAHLAGAMGVETWVMLPFVTDWRWCLGETTTPWYPTMRLFKQASMDDWDGVIARLHRELLERAKMST